MSARTPLTLYLTLPRFKLAPAENHYLSLYVKLYSSLVIFITKSLTSCVCLVIISLIISHLPSALFLFVLAIFPISISTRNTVCNGILLSLFALERL